MSDPNQQTAAGSEIAQGDFNEFNKPLRDQINDNMAGNSGTWDQLWGWFNENPQNLTGVNMGVDGDLSGHKYTNPWYSIFPGDYSYTTDQFGNDTWATDTFGDTGMSKAQQKAYLRSLGVKNL